MKNETQSRSCGCTPRPETPSTEKKASRCGCGEACHCGETCRCERCSHRKE